MIISSRQELIPGEKNVIFKNVKLFCHTEIGYIQFFKALALNRILFESLMKIIYFYKECISIIQIKWNDLHLLNITWSDLPKYNLKLNLIDIVLKLKSLYDSIMKLYIIFILFKGIPIPHRIKFNLISLYVNNWI